MQMWMLLQFLNIVNYLPHYQNKNIETPISQVAVYISLLDLCHQGPQCADGLNRSRGSGCQPVSSFY